MYNKIIYSAPITTDLDTYNYTRTAAYTMCMGYVALMLNKTQMNLTHLVKKNYMSINGTQTHWETIAMWRLKMNLN